MDYKYEVNAQYKNYISHVVPKDSTQNREVVVTSVDIQR